MKKHVNALFMSAVLILGGLVSNSCEDDITIIQDHAGGEFIAVNVSTDDTLKISSGIKVSLGDKPTLKAKKGNVIKLKFTPKEDYIQYKFETVFTLHNGKEIKNSANYEYEYTLTDVEVKDYSVYLMASSKEQDITAFGSFKLKIEE